MTFVSALRRSPGKHPRKQKDACFSIRGRMAASKGGFCGAAGPIAACRDGRKTWLPVGAHAEGRQKPAALRLLLLPPSSPGSSVRSGEAKSGPEGPLYAPNFLEKKWSGRGDSNPRPQPWQGASL